MSGRGKVMVVLGFLLHLLISPLFIAAGLLVPGFGYPLLLGLWVGLLIMQILRRKQPKIVLAIPFAAAALWFVVVQGGSWIFGWTA